MLERAARESRSIAEVLRKIGLRQSGGGHSHISRRLRLEGIDTSHFLGIRTNSGPNHRGPRPLSLSERLTLREPDDPIVHAELLRRALVALGRPYRCEHCRLASTWNGRALVLQVDHINGLHHDYRAENLRFLCPNCHSQTVNYCRRKRRRRKWWNGRHAALRTPCRKAWGFESPLPH
jgi:predicted RNA-binding Zn-ribbon protein involved in translation (DUF1610 family)